MDTPKEKNKPDPLNPDGEQLLIEKLQMEKDQFEFLQGIRKAMRKIVEREQGIYNKENK